MIAVLLGAVFIIGTGSVRYKNNLNVNEVESLWWDPSSWFTNKEEEKKDVQVPERKIQEVQILKKEQPKQIVETDEYATILSVLYAILSSVCLSLMAVQWKHVSLYQPRLPLANLTVYAAFLYGLFLIPMFAIDMSQGNSELNSTLILGILAAGLISVLGLVCLAHAFKHGIGARVQLISAL